MKILVIDDDPTIRPLVQEMLQADGHTVTCADDGKNGVEILDKDKQPGKFDLIFLDVVMPGMNGLDVLTRLKLHPHTQSIPVIMLTGEDRAEDIMSGYQVGAEYYITKPFTRQQLNYGIDLVVNGKEE